MKSRIMKVDGTNALKGRAITQRNEVYLTTVSFRCWDYNKIGLVFYVAS